MRSDDVLHMRGIWMVWKCCTRISSERFGTSTPHWRDYYQCSRPDHLRPPLNKSGKGIHPWNLSQVTEGVDWILNSQDDETPLRYLPFRPYNSEVQLRLPGKRQLPCTSLPLRDVHSQLPFLEWFYHGMRWVRTSLDFTPSLILTLSAPNPSSRDLLCSG